MIRSNDVPCLMEILAEIKLSKAAREAGYITGTNEYLSPEVLRGKPNEAARDIWALGITLYEMLTGQRPFVGETVPELFQAILTQPTPGVGGIPASLQSVLNLMLEKDPNKRISSASLINAELKALQLALSAGD